MTHMHAPSPDTATSLATGIALTERAARRIVEVAAAGAVGAALRLSVEGGGCSGFQYKFDLGGEPQPGDTVVETGGARLLVDDVSLPFVSGAEVDFVDDLMGQSFRVSNPNAAASCGCGTSFAL